MQVQASQATNNYTGYAERILKAISALEEKVNALYHNQDKVDDRSVIHTDYTVTVSNGENLSVSYTYNSLPSVRTNNIKYTNLFLRVVLSTNQNIYTLPDTNFYAIKNLFILNYGDKCYVHVAPTVTPAPILSNLDLIGEKMLPLKGLSAPKLAEAIDHLVTASQPIQQVIESNLSVPRNPMPPNSNQTIPPYKGKLSIPNFEMLGQVASKRIGDWKLVQSNFSSEFPVSYSVSIYNDTAETLSNFSPACRMQYSGTGNVLLGTNWIFPCVPFEQTFFTQAYTVNFFSQFQNGASKVLPVANANFSLNFDLSYYNTLLSAAYGITVFNEIPVCSAEELGTAAKEFYLSSRT